MKTISPSAWVVAPLTMLAVVGCTIVSNPPPTSTTAPPPAAQPAPAPTPAPTPAPVATATAQPTATATAEPAPPPTMKLPGGSKTPPGSRPPTGIRGRFSAKIPVVAGDTIFGGQEKKEGALEGKVYLLPRSMTSLPDLSAEKPVAKLYTDSLNIASQDFKTGFPDVTRRFEFFVIHYEGNFSVALPGTYTFKLVSDDGSRLRIDNVPLINNDGVHESAAKTGVIALAPGDHSIVLDYFQAQKNVALQLLVTGPDGQERPWSPKL